MKNNSLYINFFYYNLLQFKNFYVIDGSAII